MVPALRRFCWIDGATKLIPPTFFRKIPWSESGSEPEVSGQLCLRFAERVGSISISSERSRQVSIVDGDKCV
jgi:hypothetical protein